MSCAFIANAASFVLPISNPANLVVYGKHLPPLFPWLKTFLLPSLASIVVTFVVLRLISRRDLDGKAEDGSEVTALTLRDGAPPGAWRLPVWSLSPPPFSAWISGFRPLRPRSSPWQLRRPLMQGP